jgi:signal transduction histidine kinase
MAEEISEGNLNARVNLSTGDEFEKLGNTFNFMAERLSQRRTILEEKIEQATHELTVANRELQTLDKMKSDFLATISHELRTPLTAIRGGADYLSRTMKESKNLSYLAIIDKNLTRLIRLVSELFDFTRIEAHKVEWSFERENLSHLVREVIEITGPLATKKNITINFKYPGDIYADMDLERIEQVLVNLIENGTKFSDEGTEMHVEVKDDSDAVLVAVKDQGIGISKENLEIIFEKFRTLPSSEGSDKTERTGLGLAISKGIIEAHGGRIWADSEEGKGSTFFFRLPKQQS